MALAHCILGKFLGAVCDCFPPPLDVSTFATRCLYVRNDARDPSSERWNGGREMCPIILPKFRLPRKFKDLLHAANLRHGTDGFISPPKEGVLRIFFALKMINKHRILTPINFNLTAWTPTHGILKLRRQLCCLTSREMVLSKGHCELSYKKVRMV